jgi:hypothetical protein
MPDTIQASFGLDLGPLKRGFAEARQIAKSGAAGVASDMRSSMAKTTGSSVPINWQNVTPRASMAELERRYSPWRGNFGRSYPPARPGQYPVPQDEPGKRGDPWAIRGLGGRISLVVGLERAVHTFESLNDEAAQFQTKINEITKLTGSGAFRPTGELEGNIKAAGDALSEIHQRTLVETTKEGRGVFGRALMGSVRKVRQVATGDSDEKEAATVSKLRQKAAKDIDELAGKQKDLNRVKSQERSGSQLQAEVLSEEIKWREKLGALVAMEKEGISNKAAVTEENVRHQQALAEIYQTQAQKGFESLMSRQEAMRALRMVSPEKQRIGKLQDRLMSIREDLKGEHPLEERNRLTTDEINARATINQERFTKFFQSPSDRLNEQIQESRRQGQVREFQRSGGLLDAHRDMSGNIISGIDPLTNTRVGPGGVSQEKDDKPLTKSDLEDVMQKFWGG